MRDFKTVVVSFALVFVVVATTLFGGCMVIDAGEMAHDHGKSEETKVSYAPAETPDDGSVESQQGLVDQLFAAYQAGQIPWQTVEEAQRELIARARAHKTRAAMKAGAGTNGQAPATSVAAPAVSTVWVWQWRGSWSGMSIVVLVLFVLAALIVKGPFGDDAEWKSGIPSFLIGAALCGILGLGESLYAMRSLASGLWFALAWACVDRRPWEEGLAWRIPFGAAFIILFLLVI